MNPTIPDAWRAPASALITAGNGRAAGRSRGAVWLRRTLVALALLSLLAALAAAAGTVWLGQWLGGQGDVTVHLGDTTFHLGQVQAEDALWPTLLVALVALLACLVLVPLSLLIGLVIPLLVVVAVVVSVLLPVALVLLVPLLLAWGVLLAVRRRRAPRAGAPGGRP